MEIFCVYNETGEMYFHVRVYYSKVQKLEFGSTEQLNLSTHKFKPGTITQRQPALETAAAKWVASL
jgi:hypothetical protein